MDNNKYSKSFTVYGVGDSEILAQFKKVSRSNGIKLYKAFLEAIELWIEYKTRG